MTKSIPFSVAIATILLLGAPTSASASGLSAFFTDGEVSIIRAYYEDHGMPRAGKGKKAKGLPPGIAKQALPTGLIELLPPPPRGFERVVLSGKVLLVEVATQVIHDVLEDVIIG
jgi:hypothetical protein